MSGTFMLMVMGGSMFNSYLLMMKADCKRKRFIIMQMMEVNKLAGQPQTNKGQQD